MTTILYAHPYEGSLNHAILENVQKSLRIKKEEVTLIDLNADGFNPVYTKEELALYSKGEFTDPLVGKYQEILKQTDHLVLIFPIWWNTVPALMKGFFDKVLLKDFAYTKSKAGFLVGQLTNIKTATVITTSSSPRWYLKFVAGNPIEKSIIQQILKSIGIKKNNWFHCHEILKDQKDKRDSFLKDLSKYFLNFDK